MRQLGRRRSGLGEASVDGVAIRSWLPLTGPAPRRFARPVGRRRTPRMPVGRAISEGDPPRRYDGTSRVIPMAALGRSAPSAGSLHPIDQAPNPARRRVRPPRTAAVIRLSVAHAAVSTVRATRTRGDGRRRSPMLFPRTPEGQIRSGLWRVAKRHCQSGTRDDHEQTPDRLQHSDEEPDDAEDRACDGSEQPDPGRHA